MRAVLAIARREIDHYFATSIGWLSICGFLVVTGIMYVAMLTLYAQESARSAMNPYMADGLDLNEMLVPAIFSNWTIILLFVCPAIAMRMFAEDYKQRSFDLLLSSPLSSTQIVLGKYLGSLGFLAVLFACTLHYVVILFWLGTPDPGIVATSYLSAFLIAATFVAVGMFTSSLTSNQIVAFVAGFGFLLFVWFLSWFENLSDFKAFEYLAKISVVTHTEQLGKGLIHVEDVVYFATFIGFFLFATHQRVESTRWR